MGREVTHTHMDTHTEYMFDGLFVKLFKNACTIKSWFICIMYASFLSSQSVIYY